MDKYGFRVFQIIVYANIFNLIDWFIIDSINFYG